MDKLNKKQVIIFCISLLSLLILTSCSANKIENNSEYPNKIAESATISEEYNEVCQTISTAAINEYKELIKNSSSDAIKNYIVNCASSNNFEAKQDSSGSIYVDLPATPGQENNKNLILQSRMFLDANASIDLVTDSDTGAMYSKDYKSAIGADNGQGLGLCTAFIKNSKSIEHGPIRLLFTNDDISKLDASVLNSDYLISFEASRCGVCINGCAGDFPIKFDKKYPISGPTEKGASENLTIKFAKSNTTCSEIATKFLSKLKDETIHFRLASIDCNQSCVLTLNINKKNESKIKDKFKEIVNDTDKNINYQIDVSEASGKFPDRQDTDKIVDVLNCIPNGDVDSNNNKNVNSTCDFSVIKFNEGILHCEALFSSTDDNTLAEKSKEITDTLKSKKIQLEIKDEDKNPVWGPSETSLSKMYLKSLNDACKITATTSIANTRIDLPSFVEKKLSIQCISIGGDVMNARLNTETFYTKSFSVAVLPIVYIVKHIGEL